MENLNQNDDLALINKFTRRDLKQDEVYSFGIILCDNEVDRDFERFSLSAISSLSKLFVGKTGIFDHNPKGSNQTARIYSTEIITLKDKLTSTGEPLTQLKAMAYMIKTKANEDLIKEIDAGIKKEVSISCLVDDKKCSICHTDLKQDSCRHIKGHKYNNKLCYVILDKVSDAYEWSFVAVPAQINAGITKHFNSQDDNKSIFDSHCFDDDHNSTLLSSELDDLRNYLSNEIVKLAFSAFPMVKKDVILKISNASSLTQLVTLKKDLENSLDVKCSPQLNAVNNAESSANKHFKI